MKPYSQDLREKIIRALEAQEETQSEIAERFAVSLSFVERLWRQWQTTGSCSAKSHAGGQKRRLRDHLEMLRSAVAKRPDATLKELSSQIVEAEGPQVSLSTVCRELQRLELPLKKSHLTHPSEIPRASNDCAPNIARRSARTKSRG
jgi:transposase